MNFNDLKLHIAEVKRTPILMIYLILTDLFFPIPSYLLFPFSFQLMLTGLCIISLARRRNRYSYLVSN